MVRASCFALIAAGACATLPAPAVVTGAARAGEVRPLRYRLDIREVGDDVLAGTVEIDVEASGLTRRIVLDARGVSIDQARIGGAPVVVRRLAVDRIALESRDPVTGRLTIAMRFRTHLDRTPRGAFVRVLDGRVYVYTQFEPTWARRLFPCFDEPRWKTPWQLTLRIKPSRQAVSNTPVVSEVLEDGRKVVRFAETKPLPSYLLAFAIGDFVFVDAGRTRGGAPIRIVAPVTHVKGARRVAPLVQPLVHRLEDYLLMRYPFEKLDLIGVPDFNGGMENAGLITLALDAWTADFIIAHELAHQWFGDLVTIRDWHDLWLQESFATWLGNRVLDRFRRSFAPEAEEALLFDPGAVLEPKFVDDDVEAPATYDKGAAIIRMIEAWVGPARFREDVRRYLQVHAWRGATTDDFLALLPEAAPIFRQFLSRKGSPVLQMELECAAVAPRLIVRQDGPHPWRVPICVRHDAGSTCRIVDGPTTEVPLEGSCPTWVAPNQDALGFYSVVPGPALRQRLGASAMTHLSPAEHSRVLVDLLRAFLATTLPVGDALPIVSSLWREVEIGSTAWRHFLDPVVPDDLRTAYLTFVRRTAGPAEAPSAAARQAAWAWLTGGTHALDDEQRAVFEDGDRALFDKVRGLIRDPRAQPHRVAHALGLFRDPALAQAALDLAASGALLRSMVSTLLDTMADRPATRALALRFVLQRPPAYRYASWYPKLIRSICDEQTLAVARRWAQPSMKLGEAFAQAERCLALRRYHEPSLRAYLKAVTAAGPSPGRTP